MSYCINSDCTDPKNPPESHLCQTCSTPLKLQDRYRAIRVLGQGGFGKTFLAEDEGLPGQPTCVIKQLQPFSSKPKVLEQSRQLFQREAKTLGKVGQHPQIPRLLDYFESGQNFYLIQEYVSGLTLQQEVKRSGPLDEEKVKVVLKEVLSILDYLHEQKVIHRDIKPLNIIRRSIDNRLVLIDFGVVKDQDSQTSIADLKENETLTAFAVCSPGFTPLEQIAKRPVYASDIYSLGMTCLYLLTGQFPEDLDYDQSTGELKWPDQVDISPAFQRVLTKMLAVSVSDRYKSSADVMQALEQVTQTPSQSHTPVPTAEHTPSLSPLGSTTPRKRIRNRSSRPQNDTPSSSRLTSLSSFADLSPIAPKTDQSSVTKRSWWNRPLWGDRSMLERVIRVFKKIPVDDISINLHNQTLGKIESIVKKAQILDSEKFGSQDFLSFVRIQYDIRREGSEHHYLGPSIELLLVGVATRKSFLMIEQIEISYRGSKQQEFYNFVVDLLGQKLSKSEFREQCVRKVKEIIPLLKSEEGKAALQTYIEQLEILSDHDLGLKLLSLFKSYKLASFSVLCDFADMIERLRNTDLWNLKGLASQVIARQETFDHLGRIIGVPGDRRSPETYARLLQYIALHEKHQAAFNKFQSLVVLLEQWSQHYQSIAAIRQEFNPSEYKQPKEFRQKVTGVELYQKYSGYFA